MQTKNLEIHKVRGNARSPFSDNIYLMVEEATESWEGHLEKLNSYEEP